MPPAGRLNAILFSMPPLRYILRVLQDEAIQALLKPVRIVFPEFPSVEIAVLLLIRLLLVRRLCVCRQPFPNRQDILSAALSCFFRSRGFDCFFRVL